MKKLKNQNREEDVVNYVCIILSDTADSYRRRVFFNYEKRIRMQSPPEKVCLQLPSISICCKETGIFDQLING